MIEINNNNIISNLIIVNKNDDKYDINNNIIIDLDTIIKNVKNDKRFYKLINLFIKYEIHFCKQYKNISLLISIEDLLIQIVNIQNKLTKELAESILEISEKKSTDILDNSLFVDIEYIYNKFKKKLKEIEIIIYILKNIYTNNDLQKLCCISQKNNSNSTTISTSINYNTNDKYIAVYSN